MPGKEETPPKLRIVSQVTSSENDPNHWSSALKCTICLEFFSDPRCLPCGHTFCKTCIEEVIEHVRRWQADKPKKAVMFACPHCRRQLVEGHYNKFTSKNVVVESILEGWSVSSERFKLNNTKADYSTQTEIPTTESWIQTEPPEGIGISTQTEATSPSSSSILPVPKHGYVNAPSFNIASQLNQLGALMGKKQPCGSQAEAVNQSDNLSVEEALYSLQDNLLPGDNFAFGEYQLVTLPVSKPSLDGTKSLIQTLNKVFG